MSKFYLGEQSLANLAGGCDDIKRVVRSAIILTPVDFSVIETRRDMERQKELLKQRKSWTLDSDHLFEDPDGTGVLAVDLYPWVNGRTSHQARYYQAIAQAMFQASQIEGVQMYWGGFWQGVKKDSPQFAKMRPEHTVYPLNRSAAITRIGVKSGNQAT